MAEKTIKSRVKQRFDTYADWQKVWSTFKPLKGEICKIQIPANTAISGLTTSGSIRVMTKTGDGVSTIGSLPWDSAIGANETQLSKGTDTTESSTLTHGGTFTAVTDTTVSGHTITDKTTTYTLPSETAIVTDQLTNETSLTPAHGETFNVVTTVAKGNTSHNVDVTTTNIKLPAETSVSVDTLTAETGTLTHGGTFTALTAAAKGSSSHNIDVTPTTFTMPSETQLSKGTDATATAITLKHGGSFTAMTDTGVSGHQITDTTTTYTLPAETKLSKGTDSTAAVTLTHGGTFTAVTDTAVSGHKITDTTTTFTMPAETAISVDQGTPGSSKPAHGGTVTVISGVTKGDSSHNLDIAKTTITFPSETTLSKGTDATAETQTLAHGGTFTAITDIGVSGHTVTDKPTTFTLPSETTLSVTDTESGNAVTDVTVSGHAITLKRGSNFLTAHPTISKSTDSTSAVTATHGGTFTAVDSITRDGNGHVTKINTKTVTLPADNDTKDTAGGSNTSSKIYLVGVTSQATGTSYTHDTAYVGTDGHLYSNSAKVFSTSYAPEAYLTWGGRSLSGSVGPIGAALSSEHSANRLAFLNPAALSLEYSNDGGSTWTAGTWANADKINHVTTSSSITVGSASTVTTNHKTRVTLTAQNGTTVYVYTRPRKLLINVSSGGHGMNVTIEYKTGASGASWSTLGTYSLVGWSGWNDIDVSALSTLGGGTTQTSNNWYWRFTYGITSVNASYTTTKATVLGIRLFGDTCWTRTSNMGETGHLYSYDSSQNATFPAAVTATSFSGSGASLTSLNASNINSGTLAAARLPAATTSTSGAVTIGSNITVSSGTISLTGANVTTALGYTPPKTDTNTAHSHSAGVGLTGSGSAGTSGTYTYKVNLVNETVASNAASYTAGGNSKFYAVQLDKNSKLGVYVPWTDNNTTYAVATASTAGLVKPVSVITKPTLNSVTTTSGKYYQVQMSSDGNMFVNVPWTDNNTTYTFNGAVSTIKDTNLTASRALVSDSNGKVAVSAVTSTELGYLDGVTSAIQTQLNGKSDSSHTHTSITWKTF